ncbi:MAG: DUF3488 and transglutaminase-like domain-containing protein [Pseudomonadota bacterium]
MRADGRLAHSLPLIVGALLAAFLPQIATKPPWITLFLVTCAGYRLLAERRRLRLTPAWIRTILGLGSFIAVLQVYGGINGVAPGSALLAVMAALKLLETHSQRDQFVLLFICLFMILASFLQGQHIWSVVYLFGAFGVTLAAWSAAARDGVPRTGRWYAREAGVALSLALPLLLALWVLFPRVPGPFWAIPTESGSANTGLSNTMSPGDISNLSKSNALSFRASFEGPTPAPSQRYWRAIVMDRFDGRSWAANEDWATPEPNTVLPGAPGIRYTVRMEPTDQRWMYALDMPVSRDGREMLMTRFQTLESRKPINERKEYTVVSVLDYKTNTRMQQKRNSYNTLLPDGVNPRAREFATQLRGESASIEDFANRVLSHFRNEPFYYTLSPPPLGRDSVDEFVFETRRGFCEHYASAFAFMMRAAGVPARIVAGYQGGEVNPLGGFLTVRQSDAHAWTEIWIANRGWVRVDPTAAVAPQRIEQNLDSALRESGERVPGAFDLPIMERLQVAWDLVNARWDEWVLGFGPETQRNFFEWLGLENPDWRDYIVLLTVSLISIMAVITGLLWWQQRPPTRDAASRAYRALQRRTGTRTLRGEAPLAWARRAGVARPTQAAHIDAAVKLYLAARYGDEQDAVPRLRRAIRSLPRKRAEA